MCRVPLLLLVDPQMTVYDEIEYDMRLIVKSNRQVIRVNQKCDANETVASYAGVWYDMGEVEMMENHVG